MGLALMLAFFLILAYGMVVTFIESVPLLTYLFFRAILLGEGILMAISTHENQKRSWAATTAFILFCTLLPSVIFQISGIIWWQNDIDSARIAAIIISQVFLLLLFLTNRFFPTLRSRSAAAFTLCTISTIGIFLFGNYGYSLYVSRVSQQAESINEFVIHKAQPFAVYTTVRTSWNMRLAKDRKKICYLSLPFLHTYPLAHMPAGSRLSQTGSSTYIDGKRYLEVYSHEHHMAGYISEEVLEPIVTYSLKTRCEANVYDSYTQEIDSWSLTTKESGTTEVLFADTYKILGQIPAGTTVESTGGAIAIKSTGYGIISYEPIYLPDGNVGYISKKDLEIVKTPIPDS